MRNPFARPETTPQWLLGSVCWVVACNGGWLLLTCLLARWPPTTSHALSCAMPAFWLAYGLSWHRVVRGARHFVHFSRAHLSWLGAVSMLWVVFLSVYHVIGLAFGLVWTAWALFVFA